MLLCHHIVIKSALLVVDPYLGGDGVDVCDCHRVTTATQAVDEGILPINPHPHLQAAIVVSQGMGLLRWVPLLLTPRLWLHH